MFTVPGGWEILNLEYEGCVKIRAASYELLDFNSGLPTEILYYAADEYTSLTYCKSTLMGEKTPDPKEATVDDKMLDTYVGKYQLRPSLVISITKEEERLYAQATNQPRHELYAE